MVIRTPQASGQSCGQAAWTARFIKSVASSRLPVHQRRFFWQLATGSWQLVLLELQNFFFFGFAHLFHLLDFVVGEFLDFVERALLVVLGNFLVFQRLLDGVVAVATDVAHRRTMLFENPVQRSEERRVGEEWRY